MSLLGKMMVWVANEGIYLLTAETLPTEVRHIGIGTASVCGRIGGMIAPYMGTSMVSEVGPMYLSIGIFT